MSDIVERLRSHDDCLLQPIRRDVKEAADEIERLRADLATQQGCCDGAAAQDAHIRREREEHRAEVEKLRAENERLKLEPELLRAELISLANAARNALADAYDRAREVRDAFQQKGP